MSTHPDDPDAPYLPERYRQQVRAKKQHRMYKKLVAAAIVIVVIIVAYLLLGSVLNVPFPSNPQKSPVTLAPAMGEITPIPAVNVTVAVSPGYGMGTGIPSLQSSDMLSADKAVSSFHEEFPRETYTLISLNLTDRYAGLLLYEFVVRPAERASTGTPFTVFDNAVTGEPYTPGQENARITVKQAQDSAKKAFFASQPDTVRVRYSASPDSGRTWNFVLVKGATPIITGTMDAETGLISAFSRTIQKMGRPAEPVLDMPAAQKNAERYISDKNGPVAVTMSEGQYIPSGTPSDPVAGLYRFTYNRVVNTIPCDKDGFILGVDSVSGEITAYERYWNSPDNAYSVTSEPIVQKREATFAVLQRAKEKYPESVSGLRIVSAEIRWKDDHSSGVTPRPGSIPLAWKVVFDDDSIRTNSAGEPAVAWVDAQTGSILDFEYRH
ncbi:MAG: hypothetical protein Q8R70_11510 [Methanoregula sp.]|nr:hypothetical protein [Methanoregula sp.]